ncbi:MAG: 50S ribosomal protein L20 [Thermogutta sp.]|nr:50S ribosomal protein L20 [Thermogutta sp.]
MRTKTSSTRRKNLKRLFRRAKGFVGGRRKLVRTVKETLVRAGVYAYRDRRVRKREFRRLWIVRISAAVRQRGMPYSRFIDGLKKANIDLDRKTLAELAVSDPEGFDRIVEQAKAALEQPAAV